MKDFLYQYAVDNHMYYDKDEAVAYGYIAPYAITVRESEDSYVFCVPFVNAPEGETLKEISDAKATVMTFTWEESLLAARMDSAQVNSALVLAAAVQRLFAECNKARISCACKLCGNAHNMDMRKVNGEYILLCEDCRANERERGKLAIEQAAVMVRGRDFAGALGGAIISAIIYIIVYQLGATSMILGAVTGFTIAMGYQKAGGEFTARGARLCSSVGFVALLLAQFAAIGLTLFLSYFWQGVNLWQAMEMVPSFLANPAVMRAAVFDLLGAYVLMGLVDLYFYLRARKKKMKKTK